MSESMPFPDLEGMTNAELFELEARLEAEARADLEHAQELRAYAASKARSGHLRLIDPSA